VSGSREKVIRNKSIDTINICHCIPIDIRVIMAGFFSSVPFCSLQKRGAAIKEQMVDNISTTQSDRN
jgi:hypothetical protein